LIESMEVNV